MIKTSVYSTVPVVRQQYESIHLSYLAKTTWCFIFTINSNKSLAMVTIDINQIGPLVACESAPDIFLVASFINRIILPISFACSIIKVLRCIAIGIIV